MYKGFYVAWTRFENTITPDSADVFLQHIDSAGNVAIGWNTNGTGVAVTKGVYEYWPKLTMTPDGNSVFVMYASGLIGATSLIINKYNTSNGNLAAGWSTNGVTVSSGPDVYISVNHDMALYSDNSNNALAIWVESVYSGNGEIYMQQISPTGALLLNGGNERYLFGDTTGGDNGVDYVEVLQEKDKDLLIAYNNLVTFNDVAAMKVKPNGTILWNDSLITKGGNSAYPYPALDGNGGLYLFYVNTAPTPEELYGLGIDSTGKVYKGWSVPGSLFGTEYNYDPYDPNYDQNAVGTNRGEAIVAWNRVVGATFTIFTCNIHSDGSTCSSPNAIDEVKVDNEDIIVYPNPSNGIFQLKINNYELGIRNTVEVYNLLGEKVYTQLSILNSQFAIDLSNQPAGMYFVNVKDVVTGSSKTLKLIKN
jgi:type IX secretion system substrate protein